MTAKEMFESYVVYVNSNKYWIESTSDNPPTYTIYGDGDGYGNRHKTHTLIFENYTLKIIPEGIFDTQEIYDFNDVVNSRKFSKKFKKCILQQMKELWW